MGRKPSKSTGKGKKDNTPIEKDDGTRWRVVDNCSRPIYLSTGGVTKAQAERLAEGMAAPAFIDQIS